MDLVQYTSDLHSRVLITTKQEVLSGNYAGAERAYTQVLDLAPGPDNVAARRAVEGLGYIYYAQGLYPRAITPLSAWFQWEPDRCDTLRMLGITYANVGQSLDRSVAMLNRVVAQCGISDAQYFEVVSALALANCRLRDQYACGRLLGEIARFARYDAVKAASMVHLSLAEGLVPATGAAEVDIPPRWLGPTVVASNELPVVAPPLTVQKIEGEFSFTWEESAQDSILHIQSEDACSAECSPTVIQMGSPLPLAQTSTGTRQAILIVQAEVRFSNPAERAHLLGCDQADRLERTSVRMYGLSWRQYAVTKQVQDNATKAGVLINWQPAKPGAWLEMRHWRAYVLSLP